MQGAKSAIWGAGGTGRKLLHAEEVEKIYDINCFIDMDAGKWGGNLEGIPILSPDDAFEKMKINFVIVASLPGYNFIMDYLKRKEFPLANIITKFVDQPLISRIQFIHDLRTVFARRGIEGACAEAGVFEGDFAKHINECFLESRLYLFDTFSGFDSKDIEKERNLSMAKAGDYGFTSEELVMSKMKYPDMVQMCKGYFPESARDIQDDFCFVNLDLDLYAPTLSGMKWFEKHMVSGGVILVHDYFSNTFYGPHKAVEEFLSERERLSAFPIGDGISIMITGW